jgi:hypothetical protein
MTMTLDPVRIDTLDLPLAGLTEANIRLNFGAGEMHLHQAPPGKLVAGTFEGGLINRSRSSSDIELSPMDPRDVLICGHPRTWDLGITSEIPIDLQLDTGANQALVDLSALRIRQLDFHTGASDTRIRLPASGETVVNIHCGLASIVVEVPQGVAAQIRGKVVLGGTKVDETRFPRMASGIWASRDYPVATNRVDITVGGGFGSARIV